MLDDHFAEAWRTDMGDRVVRARRRRNQIANYRLVRYADDLVLMVPGTGTDAEQLRGELAEVLAPIGLRLSDAKTVSLISRDGPSQAWRPLAQARNVDTACSRRVRSIWRLEAGGARRFSDDASADP